jgi:hypothetical protein
MLLLIKVTTPAEEFILGAVYYTSARGSAQITLEATPTLDQTGKSWIVILGSFQ